MERAGLLLPLHLEQGETLCLASENLFKSSGDELAIDDRDMLDARIYDLQRLPKSRITANPVEYG
jgi:hypothetical protein